MVAPVGLVFRRDVGGRRKGRWEAGERPDLESVIELCSEIRNLVSDRLTSRKEGATQLDGTQRTYSAGHDERELGMEVLRRNENQSGAHPKRWRVRQIDCTAGLTNAVTPST